MFVTLDIIFQSSFCILRDFRCFQPVNIWAFSLYVTFANTWICQNTTSLNQIKAQFEAQIKIYVCRFFKFDISLALYI